MEFDAAVRRLEILPDVLPDGPLELMPVLVETGEPRVRPPWDAEAASSSRPAAVLVLLYPDADGLARILLTERADRGGHHSGEVSFPGGRAEPHDADAAATALREAAEEVGLDAVGAGVRVLGESPDPLDPGQQLRGDPGDRDRRAAPAPGAPAHRGRRDPRAARVLVPSGRAAELVERDIRGLRVRYAAYPIDGLVVWGMTARVLGGLGAWLGPA